MENPIRSARLARGMTQKGLAKLADVTPHALLRYEQGLYEEISPNIINTITLIDEELTPQNLNQQYQAFRLEKQQAACRHLYPLPVVEANESEHPFKQFEDAVMTRMTGKPSRIGFCILLAINPAVVLNYDKGKQGPMPSLIRSALHNAGVYDSYIGVLDIYGQRWFENFGT